MPIFQLPPAVDLNYYRQAYPELNTFPDDVLAEHCRRFAVEQGRSTCFYDRREFLQVALQKLINDAHLKALEISPWYNPFLRGNSVKYFGLGDSEALRKSAAKSGLPVNNVPEKIDFISSTGDLGLVNETFDIVFSSHVIEHTPDLVAHLQGVSRLLNRGGVYVLIVPDKRYCFDHYKTDSTIGEVMDAFVTKRKYPCLADFINTMIPAHNDAIRHWLGEHDKANQETLPEKILLKMERYSAALTKGEYIDMHNWRFTPDSFGYIVNVLNKLTLIDLTLFRLCHTIWGRLEFVAMLEKS